MVNWRRLALDLNWISRKLSHLFGMMSIRTEKWYYDLTEKEKK